ncbi:MAG TPA: HAMP domain-containing sensor histidine kinase, partial [Burkholderiaceae bacterium]|nr:HAMP domain-containing sensor histidine kinase [Burkholderiaceae bacterium]
ALAAQPAGDIPFRRVAFERFERETAYHRARAFLVRVADQYDNLFEQQQRQPEYFNAWLTHLVLFEPDSQLYLLDLDGRVLGTSARIALTPELRVAMGPVRESAAARASAYVMGDDPERMDADAVVAAHPLRRASIQRSDAPSGYLYIVCHPGGEGAASRWAAVRSSYGIPALVTIGVIVALMTALAAWLAASITRPLARLTAAVAAVSREGLEAGAGQVQLPRGGSDEFGQLATMFRQMLAKLHEQWTALSRLDQFRREAVSNLSHDLRSPLTATVACLETLQTRRVRDDSATAEPQLIEVALRNTRNAARLVQSLGDLARLDEPEFRLQPMTVDVGELISDIVLRFAERAAAGQVALRAALPDDGTTAWLDVELFERAVANLLDNALKFCRAGDAVEVSARAHEGRLQVSVSDTGAGIAEADQALLFDRFFRGGQGRVAQAASAGGAGLGLGLAIVKRIAELHGGDVVVRSAPSRGTTMTLVLPIRPPPASGKP